MKKVLSIAIAAVMVFSLAACGGGSTSAPATTAAPAATEAATTAAPAATEAAPAETEAAAPAGEEIVMKLANPNPVGDVKDLASIRFSELASEYTNGRVKIEVYSGGTLGDARETLEGLSLGTNEIVCESIGTMSPFTNLANFDAVPYMYRDYDHYKAAFLDGELGEEVKEAVGEDGGFKILGGMYRGARVCTTKKKFTTPEELKASGLKIRVPSQQIYIDTWQVMGANPTPLALNETFTALQQNTVEAQENATIESYGFGFYDVCPYLVKTNHVYSTDVFIFDRNYFNNLDADIQEALIKAAKEASDYRSEMSLNMEGEFEEKFKEKGVEIVEIDTAPFIELFDGFLDEYYPEFADWAAKVAEY